MKVLCDSNILIKYLVGDEKARTLVEKVINSELSGYIAGTIASETIYVYLRLALDVSRYKLKELITKKDGKVKNLLEEDVRPLLFALQPDNTGNQRRGTLKPSRKLWTAT